jgi:hypothetical protein
MGYKKSFVMVIGIVLRRNVIVWDDGFGTAKLLRSAGKFGHPVT